MTLGNKASRKGSAALREAERTPLDQVDGIAVDIRGTTHYISELSLNQLIAIGRLIARAAQTLADSDRDRVLKFLRAQEQAVNDAEAAAGEPVPLQEQISSGITVIMDVLDEQAVGGLFGIVLNLESSVVLELVTARKALEIIDKFLDVNPWEELQESFFSILRKLGLRGQEVPAEEAPSTSLPESSSPTTTESPNGNGHEPDASA